MCVGLGDGCADSRAGAKDADDIGQFERRFGRIEGGTWGSMERRGYLEAS